nr:hypothetical protein CFP56_11100 [Quercus suber]
MEEERKDVDCPDDTTTAYGRVKKRCAQGKGTDGTVDRFSRIRRYSRLIVYDRYAAGSDLQHSPDSSCSVSVM